VTLPAFAAERLRACSTAVAATDGYLLPARRSAANPPAAGAAVDRQTGCTYRISHCIVAGLGTLNRGHG